MAIAPRSWCTRSPLRRWTRDRRPPVELTIDTASPTASVALTERGALLAEITWKAGRGHAAELIPAIERLLAGGHASMSDIGAVFVNRGPGGYAGLRVGLSTALSIAYARGADVLGY